MHILHSHFKHDGKKLPISIFIDKISAIVSDGFSCKIFVIGDKEPFIVSETYGLILDKIRCELVMED